MAKSGPPRRRPEAPSAPTTLTEIARRYYACAVALAKAMGLPLTETFLREHRESISCCFIEAGRAGVRLPPAVQLPPLSGPPAADPPAEAGEIMCSGMPPAPEAPPTNGDTPPLSVITTVAELPTRIPAGLQLPCAEALITDLRPPQLSLLIGKVGLRALAEKSLEPLHVALLAERARRFEGGKKPTPDANGHGA
jgi:hypothetical protein